MQYLQISETTTLTQLANMVGDRNVDAILTANSLKRTPNVGKAFAKLTERAMAISKPVSWEIKTNVLNTMTGDDDVFEYASTMSENAWRIYSVLDTFPGMLKIPESVVLPSSTSVLGGTDAKVGTNTYVKVMDSLKSESHTIDPAIFNTYSTISKDIVMTDRREGNKVDLYSMFKLPWGKITLYSSLSDETIDFPVYPEELSDGRKANFTTMPDTLYQYEPWYTYQSSGPRQMTYTFHFHRDMWTGNHLDGKANELVRFCEACCYPNYNGSAVNVTAVTLYINGQKHIHGIMTEVRPKWSGPIGRDGWYLECELEISITEVSEVPLSYQSMRQKGIIGDN